jgi:hypothetical protein
MCCSTVCQRLKMSSSVLHKSEFSAIRNVTKVLKLTHLEVVDIKTKEEVMAAGLKNFLLKKPRKEVIRKLRKS